MRRLSSQPDKLELVVHCLGPAAADRAAASLPGVVRTSVVGRPEWMRPDEPIVGSSGHGACVEDALAMTDDGNIHIIADSDTVMLAKGWDDYLRKRLLVDDVGILGVTYEDIGGFSSGSKKSQTYKGMPNAVWMALSPKHSWKQLKAQPHKGRDIVIDTQTLAAIYNLPVGYQVLRDVAWQIPQYLFDRKISYVGLKQLKPTKDAVVLKNLSDYHEEYHADSVPFVAHHRGSLRHAYRSDKISRAFYQAVDAWLASEDNASYRWSGSQSAPAVFQKEPSELTTEPQQSSEPIQVDRALQWVKVSLDGEVIQQKRTPAPSSLTTMFEPDRMTRHLRVEGNSPWFEIVVPDGKKKPHHVIVRNMLPGQLTVSTGASCTDRVIIPGGKTVMLLIDLDSVVQVG